MTDKILKVGVITSAHGIRGQVRIRSFTGSPESILEYSPLCDATGSRQFRLTRDGTKEQLLIVSIDGVTDRNAAELLKGTELYAPAAKKPPTKENQWYYGELTGLEARRADGTAYGKVTGVYNFGAGDIIEIERPDGKSEMLPFNGDFIGEVRAAEGYLVVFPPAYLETNSDQPE